MDPFQQVNSKASFSDLMKPKNGESSEYFHCGICNDSDAALKVYEDGNWKCHSCGAKGSDIIEYHAQEEGITRTEAAKDLADTQGLDVEFGELSEEEKEEVKEKRKVFQALNHAVEKARENMPSSKREKLKDWRNWSDDTIEDLKIGWMNEALYNNLSDRYQETLEKTGLHFGMIDPDGEGSGTFLFPHLKRNGQPYLVTARKEHNESDPRYVQSKSTEFVDNDIYYATGHDSDTLVVTEGYPDAVSAYEEGFDSIAAGSGSFKGNKHRIGNFAENNYETVFVISDNDDTGLDNLQSIAETLTNSFDVEVRLHRWRNSTPEKYDLDDYTSDNPGELEDLIKDAETYLEAFKNYCPSSVDASLVGDRIVIRGNVKGQKEGDAIPSKAQIYCRECGHTEELDLSSEKEQKDLLTSGKNHHNYIQSRISGKECPDCEQSNWGHNITEYVDKKWLTLQDLAKDSDGFQAAQNNKIPAYLLDEEIPKSKKVRVEGEVFVNPQNDTKFLLADKAKPEEQSFHNVELEPEEHKEFLERWEKEKAEKMVAPDMVGRPKARTALQLTAHSPLRIPTLEGKTKRGALRTGFFGDGGTYKSDQIKQLTKNDHNLGGFVNAENSGRTGLTWTIDTDKRIIEWGALALNDRGLVGIDGLNELSDDDLTQMREVFEDMKIEVNKSVKGSAPARTRVIGAWNPYKTPISNHYDHPADALKDMQQFTGPDFRRWDLLVPFQKKDVDQDDIHFRDPGEKPYSDEFYEKHVKWAWNLEPEDIELTQACRSSLKQNAFEVAKKYEYTNIPIVTGAFREKLTRIAVSFAVLRHSITENYRVEVTEEHVKEAAEFFSGLMKDLGMDEEIEDWQNQVEVSEEEFERLQEELEDDQVEILRVLKDQGWSSAQVLAEEIDLGKRTVKKKCSKLKSESLIKTESGRGRNIRPKGRDFLQKCTKLHECTGETREGGGVVDPQSQEKEGETEEDTSDTPPTPSQSNHANVQLRANSQVSEQELINLLKSQDGELYKSEIKEAGLDTDQVFEKAHEVEQVDEDYGTPEGSNQVEPMLVLEGGEA